MKKNIIAALFFSSLLLSGCNLKKVIIISAADLSGKKIGVQNGSTGEEYVLTKVQNAEPISYKTLTDATEQLIKKNIDAIVIDEYPALLIVKENPDLMIIRDKVFEQNKEDYAIAVKKGNTALLNSINETIKTLQSNGKYDELVRVFISHDSGLKIPEIEPTPANRTLKLGTNAQFAPFEYILKKDIIGFDISLGEYIAQKEFARLQVMDLSFSHLIDALKANEIDFIAAAMTVTEERKKEVDFSIPYFTSEQVIIIRK